MSFAFGAPNLQIWDNAAFDDALFADDPTTAKAWLPLQPISTNLSHFSNLSTSKEKASKKPRKEDLRPIPDDDDDDDLDAEIEEVEKEIRRLSLKLEALRIKKAEMDLRVSTARRGRIVPAKFMELKPSPASKKMEESPARLQRRGFSLGPLEIHGSAAKSCFQKLEGIKEEKTPSKPRPSATKAAEPKLWPEVHGFKNDSSGSCYRKRGLSLGPSDIAFSARCHLPNKLQDDKKKEKKMSLTVSPRSRKPAISSFSDLRKGIATVGAKKSVQKDDSIMGSLKPKNIFQEMQNPVSCKKLSKNEKVRIVASRYSLATARNDGTVKKRRKWSLPEPNKRSLSIEDSSNGSEAQGKGKENEEPLTIASSPPSIMKMATMLPVIRTFRSIGESPRDSGCAKRAAQLVGKKSYFSMEDGQDSVVYPSKILKFDEKRSC